MVQGSDRRSPRSSASLGVEERGLHLGAAPAVGRDAHAAPPGAQPWPLVGGPLQPLPPLAVRLALRALGPAAGAGGGRGHGGGAGRGLGRDGAQQVVPLPQEVAECLTRCPQVWTFSWLGAS